MLAHYFITAGFSLAHYANGQHVCTKGEFWPPKQPLIAPMRKNFSCRSPWRDFRIGTLGIRDMLPTRDARPGPIHYRPTAFPARSPAGSGVRMSRDRRWSQSALTACSMSRQAFRPCAICAKPAIRPAASRPRPASASDARGHSRQYAARTARGRQAVAARAYRSAGDQGGGRDLRSLDDRTGDRRARPRQSAGG